MRSKSLVILGADKDILVILRTVLLERGHHLGIRTLREEDVTFHRDVLHDSSPIARVTDMLRGYQRSHSHALVVRDLAGSGYEDIGQERLAAAITEALVTSGWTRAQIKTIVIAPEVEAWMRFSSGHLEALVRTSCRQQGNWSTRAFRLRIGDLIEKHGGETSGKPNQPKEVFVGLLQTYGIPRSSALYEHLASKETLRGCRVPSFCEFAETMRGWFPLDQASEAPHKPN